MQARWHAACHRPRTRTFVPVKSMMPPSHTVRVRLLPTIRAIEDLHVQGTTRSAQGTVATPGRHVKAKSGLNRGILASDWGQWEQRLAYKCDRLVKVPAAYASQTCHRCGGLARANRTTQSRFCCIDCGLQLNAAWNAALHILGRGDLPVARGTGATARRGACPWGTPVIREQDISESVYLGI